jgi:hypothetical protein
VRIKDPNDALTDYIYGVDPEIVRVSLGVYTTSWQASLAGPHTMLALSTAPDVATEVDFSVTLPKVPRP